MNLDPSFGPFATGWLVQETPGFPSEPGDFAVDGQSRLIAATTVNEGAHGNLGFRVSGSDAKKAKNTDRLESLFGITISEDHAAENVGDAQVVVYSSAVKDDNPEVVVAKEKGIPVIPRAEMLAELMVLKPYAVAVSGTHGKTSTTSMVATILGHAGVDPSMGGMGRDRDRRED